MAVSTCSAIMTAQMLVVGMFRRRLTVIGDEKQPKAIPGVSRFFKQKDVTMEKVKNLFYI